jgi:hypothetical protein
VGELQTATPGLLVPRLIIPDWCWHDMMVQLESEYGELRVLSFTGFCIIHSENRFEFANNCLIMLVAVEM